LTASSTVVAIALLVLGVGATSATGIRPALCASAGSLVGLVMRQATIIAIVGIGFGLAASLAAGRVLASLLFGITPRDPIALLSAPAALGLTALVAASAARTARRLDRSDQGAARRVGGFLNLRPETTGSACSPRPS
jgi:hypothetical protein